MGAMGFLELLDEQLAELEQHGLLRASRGVAEDGLIDVSTNDYLGFASEPVSRATLLACEGVPSGAGASRLIHGTREAHESLEASLADWVGLPAALLFSSGFAANYGALTALISPEDLVISDALNHASIIDACRQARATVRVTPHRDATAIASALASRAHFRHAWVVTESYFSMDGDSPDLPQLRALCDAHDAALIVDEAHALGVHGPQGSGLCRAASVTPDVLIGTLGKAVGLQGAFVAGDPRLRLWLWNRARSLVFSTAPSPLLARLTEHRVRQVRRADDRRATLKRRSADLRELLRLEGNDNHGPVLPVLLGDIPSAVAAEARLRASRFLARAIRPPTVPPGTARLRLTAHASWSPDIPARLAEALTTQ
jgi:8-amino-7-oxononanoate synthase